MQNIIFRILWGLIALQSFVFAFDYPIAYTTTNPIECLMFSEVKTINNESLKVIDIYPENSDRDFETMDSEFFQIALSFKTDNPFPFFIKSFHVGYKQPYFPKKHFEVFSPPPEQYCFS